MDEDSYKILLDTKIIRCLNMVLNVTKTYTILPEEHDEEEEDDDKEEEDEKKEEED
ncbi:hypothetical protein EV426DRAFT_708980 [Tirmania nivea]|nr:hypothetical protein EV426DRAFT_708980 [Tirmania nivea]